MNPIGMFAGVYCLLQKMDKAGDRIEGHEHPHDHLSIVMRGRVRVTWRYTPERWAELEAAGAAGKRRPEGSIEFNQGDTFPVLAQACHAYEAIDGPAEVWCVHARRDIDGQVLGAPTWEDYLEGTGHG